MADWNVIVPVYNEEDHLDNILESVSHLGYADRITFVNDASTDSSRNILDAWAPRLDCQVIHLKENAKKEGAIKAVLESMKEKGAMAEYTILLDADSYMNAGESDDIAKLVGAAIEYIQKKNIVGMAFRIEAIIPYGLSLFERSIYADYAGVQFDNWLTSKFDQMWVINGPGGIFDSNELLLVLQNMVLDFETGDLQVTVSLMKKGLKVGFWPEIKVETWVPKNYGEYFEQRRRWERGSIKVLWTERLFYFKQFQNQRILAFYTALYLLFPAGILAMPIVLAFQESPVGSFLEAMVAYYLFWTFVTILKCSMNVSTRRDGMLLKACLWSFMGGFFFVFSTGPARIIGFFEAVIRLYRRGSSIKNF